MDEAQLPEIILEVPKEKTHGDFATNVAMQLTRIAKVNPRQIAEQIIANLKRTQLILRKRKLRDQALLILK